MPCFWTSSGSVIWLLCATEANDYTARRISIQGEKSGAIRVWACHLLGTTNWHKKRTMSLAEIAKSAEEGDAMLRFEVWDVKAEGNFFDTDFMAQPLAATNCFFELRNTRKYAKEQSWGESLLASFLELSLSCLRSRYLEPCKGFLFVLSALRPRAFTVDGSSSKPDNWLFNWEDLWSVCSVRVWL